MTRMWVAVAVLIIAAAAGIWLILTPTPQTDSAQATSPASTGKIVPVWKFTDKGEDEQSLAPMTAVTLTLGEKTYDAGTYQGSCSEIGSSGGVDGTGLIDGEVSGVQCWFAGGGDEIGLFRESAGLVLKKGELGEPLGETEGFRGNFTTILSIGA